MHFTLDQVQTYIMNIPTIKNESWSLITMTILCKYRYQFDLIGKTIIIVILLIIIVFQPLTMNTTMLSSSIRNLTIIEETMNTTMGWLLNITITNLKSTSKSSCNYEHYINWFNVEHNSQYNNRQYTIRLN